MGEKITNWIETVNLQFKKISRKLKHKKYETTSGHKYYQIAQNQWKREIYS